MQYLKVISVKLSSNKLLVNNVIGTISLKGIAIILSFVMTPMYLSYFDDQSILGVWYTLLSILTWILTFDFGIGNGLRNKLAYSIVLNDKEKAKSLISSAYLVLGGISAALIIMICIFVPMVNWQKALNNDIDLALLTTVILIVMIGIMLQFFFKIVTSILFALKKNVLANSLSVVTNILILLFLLFSRDTNDNQKIIKLAYVHSIATILPLVLTTVYIFALPLKGNKPTIGNFSKQATAEVLSVGGLFFMIQLGLLVINSTNQVLVNNHFGGESVVVYTIYYRLYGMATMFFTLFTQPVWSEISAKYAVGHFQWIKKVYRVMLGLATLISLCCILVTFLLPWIFHIWLGTETQIFASRSTGFLFTIWITVELFVMASTCIANGMTKLKCQTLLTPAVAVMKIPVTLLMVSLNPSWRSIIIAHIIVLLPLMISQNYVLHKQLSSNKFGLTATDKAS